MILIFAPLFPLAIFLSFELIEPIFWATYNYNLPRGHLGADAGIVFTAGFVKTLPLMASQEALRILVITTAHSFQRMG